MFRGIQFMWKFAWRSDKAYICIRVLQQFVAVLAPLATVTLPKFIIDELTGAQCVDRLIILAGGYLLTLFAADALSVVTAGRRCMFWRC